MTTITHIVHFQFKSSASAEAIKEICDSMLALKHKCIHPTSSKPYIISSSGGRDNSPEGIQAGITHAFVVEFANVEDRDYYVSQDPAHLAFIKAAGEVVEKAQVVDYTPNVF